MMRGKAGSAGGAVAPAIWRIGYWLIVAGTALSLCWAYSVGRDMRAAAQDHLEQAIADEDHAFCERFGLRAGTDDFASCCRRLSIIRQRQRERDDASVRSLI